MSNPGLNRPFKFGPGDKREYITYNSEVEIRCENDASGNPIYIGRAKSGVSEGSLMWQISKQTWDASNSLLTKKWPQNSDGDASVNYEFSWTDRATYTFS